tara:strand:+ start:1157 stop:1639 length:483 start_codon:yes stop_codon:yes gene_type:complete
MTNVSKKIDVFGIGLPRTGTTSLSEALSMLGYSGTHSCSIFGSKDGGTGASGLYLVDNQLYADINRVVLENKKSKFILTTRDDCEWRDSIDSFSLSGLPSPSEYGELVSGLFAANKLENLLIINFQLNSDIDNWNQICSFLKKSVPSENFPCVRNLKRQG